MAIDKTERDRQAEPNRQTEQVKQGGKAKIEQTGQKKKAAPATKKKKRTGQSAPKFDTDGTPLLNKDGTPNRRGKREETCKTQKVKVVEAEEITPQTISEARLQAAIDRTVKRIEGKHRKNAKTNCCVEDKVDASRDEIRRIILNSLHWWRMETPTSDEQVAERLNEFLHTVPKQENCPRWRSFIWLWAWTLQPARSGCMGRDVALSVPHWYKRHAKLWPL